jgi:hypothetical protein
MRQRLLAARQAVRAWLGRHVYFSYWTVVAVAVAVVAWNGWQLREVRHLGSENRNRISENRDRIVEVAELADANTLLLKQQAEIRAELVRGLKRADVIACRRAENLKAQNRRKARENYASLDRSLRLLNIERTPELERLAKNNLNRDLRLNAQKPCGSLPP